MKIREKRTIEAEVDGKVLCDICGERMRSLWDGAATREPVGGYHDMPFDVCTECCTSKLLPWIESQRDARMDDAIAEHIAEQDRRGDEIAAAHDAALEEAEAGEPELERARRG